MNIALRQSVSKPSSQQPTSRPADQPTNNSNTQQQQQQCTTHTTHDIQHNSRLTPPTQPTELTHKHTNTQTVKQTTTSGHFVDTQGLTGYEPKLTTRENMVAWADTLNSYGAQAACGPISSVPPWRSTRYFTDEATAQNYRNLLAEQHVCWREHGRNALNFSPSSSRV